MLIEELLNFPIKHYFHWIVSKYNSGHNKAEIKLIINVTKRVSQG